MRIVLPILTLAFLFACSGNSANEIISDSNKEAMSEDSSVIGWNYREVEQSYLDTLLGDVCSTEDLEFIDLYTELDSIASDEFENLVLVDSLKSMGFKVTNWGRGNWMEGPRMINFTLSNEQCECQIDKLYYSTKSENKFKVTERIKCDKVSK